MQAVHVRILRDTISPAGDRILTLEMILSGPEYADMRTHYRAVGLDGVVDWYGLRFTIATSRTHRNARRQQVEERPVLPEWHRNGKSPLSIGPSFEDEPTIHVLDGLALDARDAMLRLHAALVERGVSTEQANVYLYPWMEYRCVVTATLDTWFKIFAQRAVEGRGPGPRLGVRRVMCEAKRLIEASTPVVSTEHFPLAEEDEGTEEERLKLSVARCARYSSGSVGSREEDIALYDLRLVPERHEGAFEHTLRACPGRHGPYIGWRPVRYDIFGE